MTKKVALVGTAPSGAQAPFTDLSWDIWGVGLRADHTTRATRWYELHRIDSEPKSWAHDWREAMKKWPADCPIYMFYPEPIEGKEIVPFDPKPLSAKYGTFFMTSSFSWMMAQALEEDYDEIGIWGVDMEYDTEYRQQRSGLRHFIEIAKLLGKKITRVTTSGIAYEPIPYPFWCDDPIISKTRFRKKIIKQNLESAKYTFESMNAQALRFEGAHKEMASILKSDAAEAVKAFAQKRVERLLENVESIRQGAKVAHDDAKLAEGALQELAWLEDYMSP